MNISNSSTDAADLYPISYHEAVLFSLGYYLISIVSIFGNSLIILAIGMNKSMHNVTNYFITNLAVADIIISIFCTPFQVTQLVFLIKIGWLNTVTILVPRRYPPEMGLAARTM